MGIGFKSETEPGNLVGFPEEPLVEQVWEAPHSMPPSVIYSWPKCGWRKQWRGKERRDGTALSAKRKSL